MGKFFNVTVKPTIVASVQNTQFGNNDVLFDWKEFDLPKGGSRLNTVTAMVRGEDGAATSNPQHLHFFFAKSINGVAPPSLGTANDTADGIGYFNHIIGASILDKTDGLVDGMDFMTVFQSGNTSASNVPGGISFNTDDFSTATANGYERYYVAAIHHGGNGLNFTTGVLLNQAGHQAAATVATTLTTSGTHATKVFAIGDVIVTADGEAVGTVTAVGGTTSITVDAVAEAFVHTDELLNTSPVSLVLHYEK